MIPSQQDITPHDLELIRVRREAENKVVEFLTKPPEAKIEIPEEIYTAFFDILCEVTCKALTQLKKDGLI